MHRERVELLIGKTVREWCCKCCNKHSSRNESDESFHDDEDTEDEAGKFNATCALSASRCATRGTGQARNVPNSATAAIS